MRKQKPSTPKEWELYQNPNDRMHPWNYREFLLDKGQLPKGYELPPGAQTDLEMYDKLLGEPPAELKKPKKSRKVE
ncbi:MAG: hypothetical protein V1703_02850 [Candidatus Altiarchaeota archaeon]